MLSQERLFIRGRPALDALQRRGPDAGIKHDLAVHGHCPDQLEGLGKLVKAADPVKVAARIDLAGFDHSQRFGDIRRRAAAST